MTCKIIVPINDQTYVSSGTLHPTLSYHTLVVHVRGFNSVVTAAQKKKPSTIGLLSVATSCTVAGVINAERERERERERGERDADFLS